MQPDNYRGHLVLAFYHILTWYASPEVLRYFLGKTVTNVEGYILGFFVSIVLYMTVGKAYIGEY